MGLVKLMEHLMTALCHNEGAGEVKVVMFPASPAENIYPFGGSGE